MRIHIDSFLIEVIGEALAAIALIRAAAEFLSPLIVGSVMNITIDTRLPQAVFFIAAVSNFCSSVYRSDSHLLHASRSCYCSALVSLP